MKKVIVVIFIVLIIVAIGAFIAGKHSKDVETAEILDNNIETVEEKIKKIPAVIIKNSIANEGTELKRGDRLEIIEEKEEEYLIEFNGKQDLIKKENVRYFKFNKEEKYSLAIDVSEFNIDSKGLTETSSSFKDNIDFASFIISNNINYAYIRIGGRGWGQKGTLYNDDNAKLYIDICEYLKIPYGFYYIEEALNEEEVLEEVDFIKTVLKQQELEMNILPLAIDLEYQDGKGRTDNTWKNRTDLINLLIDELKKIELDTIIYANGARIETFLKKAHCNYWTAMYIKDNKIPKEDYKTVVVKEEEKIKNNPELLNTSFLNTELNKKRNRNCKLYR